SRQRTPAPPRHRGRGHRAARRSRWSGHATIRRRPRHAWALPRGGPPTSRAGPPRRSHRGSTVATPTFLRQVSEVLSIPGLAYLAHRIARGTKLARSRIL